MPDYGLIWREPGPGDETGVRREARMKAGYWCFQLPHGYISHKTKEHGKLMLRHEPVASQIQEAIEGYAPARKDISEKTSRFVASSPAPAATSL